MITLTMSSGRLPYRTSSHLVTKRAHYNQLICQQNNTLIRVNIYFWNHARHDVDNLLSVYLIINALVSNKS